MNNERITFSEAKDLYAYYRNKLREMLSLALEFGNITEKEHRIMNMRMFEYKTFEEVGIEFGVTRERIRQIDAKVNEVLRQLTKPTTGNK